MIIIRANQDPPMNENDPKDISTLITYLDREQYGDFPIFERRFTTEPYQQGVYTNYSSELDFWWRYSYYGILPEEKAGFRMLVQILLLSIR